MSMRVDRERLKIFIMNLRIREVADEEKLTDSELVEELAEYFETTPTAIDLEYKKPKPFYEANNTDFYD
jgi:hypothetical protein